MGNEASNLSYTILALKSGLLFQIMAPKLQDKIPTPYHNTQCCSLFKGKTNIELQSKKYI